MSTVLIQKFNQKSVELPKVFAIAGATGIGKTAWIRQQIAKTSEPVVYFYPNAGNVAIDSTTWAR
jgi:flagellar biosynthesis GTPase FlhF